MQIKRRQTDLRRRRDAATGRPTDASPRLARQVIDCRGVSSTPKSLTDHPGSQMRLAQSPAVSDDRRIVAAMRVGVFK
jgi:hypothetical protein